MGNKRDSEQWTEEKLEEEIDALKPKDSSEVVFQGVRQPRKKGRPKRYETVKTNLDLTESLMQQLDTIAIENGFNRQTLIKHFILNGLKDYYTTETLKKNSG